MSSRTRDKRQGLNVKSQSFSNLGKKKPMPRMRNAFAPPNISGVRYRYTQSISNFRDRNISQLRLNPLAIRSLVKPVR